LVAGASTGAGDFRFGRASKAPAEIVAEKSPLVTFVTAIQGDSVYS